VKNPQVPELNDKPEAKYAIECRAEVNQHHAQISPSCYTENGIIREYAQSP